MKSAQQRALELAATNLYYAAYWKSDRLNVEEEDQLWKALADALALPKGQSEEKLGPPQWPVEHYTA